MVNHKIIERDKMTEEITRENHDLTEVEALQLKVGGFPAITSIKEKTRAGVLKGMVTALVRDIKLDLEADKKEKHKEYKESKLKTEELFEGYKQSSEKMKAELAPLEGMKKKLTENIKQYDDQVEEAKQKKIDDDARETAAKEKELRDKAEPEHVPEKKSQPLEEKTEMVITRQEGITYEVTPLNQEAKSEQVKEPPTCEPSETAKELMARDGEGPEFADSFDDEFNAVIEAARIGLDWMLHEKAVLGQDRMNELLDHAGVTYTDAELEETSERGM